jgi:hypothetical protein
MIDGESRGFAGGVSLAHRLLFFIVSDRSSVIRNKLGNITPIKRGERNYEIPTGYANH